MLLSTGGWPREVFFKSSGRGGSISKQKAPSLWVILGSFHEKWSQLIYNKIDVYKVATYVPNGRQMTPKVAKRVPNGPFKFRPNVTLKMYKTDFVNIDFHIVFIVRNSHGQARGEARKRRTYWVFKDLCKEGSKDMFFSTTFAKVSHMAAQPGPQSNPNRKKYA